MNIAPPLPPQSPTTAPAASTQQTPPYPQYLGAGQAIQSPQQTAATQSILPQAMQNMPAEGTRATNQRTGKPMIFTNGRWMYLTI
jgi:hypothetical protein